MLYTPLREFFNDAIPSVSTAASASLMREMIEAGEISSTQADLWLTSLVFVAQPSSDMIREISPLLQTEQPTRKMYLTISSLVNSYCRQNDDCVYNRDVQEVSTRPVKMHADYRHGGFAGKRCHCRKYEYISTMKALEL